MKTPRQIRRLAIGIIGGTVVLIGLALIVLPGPAFVVIPAGLAILATEFAWARSWLRKAKNMITRKKKEDKEEKEDRGDLSGSRSEA